MQVLVVDDDPAIRQLIKDIFMHLGHNVKEASTVEEAFAIIENNHIDLTFVDFIISEGVGTDIVRHIKRVKPDTLIIGISALNKKKSFYDAGADNFIQKPFSIKEILCIVEEL